MKGRVPYTEIHALVANSEKDFGTVDKLNQLTKIQETLEFRRDAELSLSCFLAWERKTGRTPPARAPPIRANDVLSEFQGPYSKEFIDKLLLKKKELTAKLFKKEYDKQTSEID